MDYVKYDFPFPVFVHHNEDHSEMKDELLSLMKEQNSEKVKINCNISRTDWYSDLGEERKYFSLLRRYIDIPIKQILTETQPTGDCGFNYVNVWFQQYNRGDYHIWHNHGSSWAGVYFLELPSKTLATEFFVPFTRETIKFEVSEGDLLIFPGILFHRSPANESVERKSIIAFNLTPYY